MSQNNLIKALNLCDSLPDLRRLFLGITDAEKVKDAALHFLGDDHQILSRIADYEKKIVEKDGTWLIKIELAIKVWKRGRIRYTPQIIDTRDGCCIWYLQDNEEWDKVDYTEFSSIDGAKLFDTKVEAYQVAFDWIDSQI